MELTTARLTLRRWRDGDREPFAALNADPRVMEHFPSTLTRQESDTLVDRIERHFEERGFGLWAVEHSSSGRFLGFTGLSVPRFRAAWMENRPTPVVEVGWRFRRDAWGRGYATEAAREALRVAFEELRLPEVVSFTAVGNTRSRAVMQRLGMTELATYDHPLPDGDPLPSVVYVLTGP